MLIMETEQVRMRNSVDSVQYVISQHLRLGGLLSIDGSWALCEIFKKLIMGASAVAFTIEEC